MQNAHDSSKTWLHGVFRKQHTRCIGILARFLGSERLDLAEEAVQEAFLRALRIWPLRGIPERPEAWLLRVAQNYAIDVCRKEKRLQTLLPEIGASPFASTEEALGSLEDGVRFENEIRDGTLAMMFACCHPALTSASQVALTLKVVSGFSVTEIARAFFASETTIAQRLVRAKRQLRELKLPFEIPPPEALPTRLHSVLDVLYLVFNEGYTCHESEEVVHTEWMEKALQLISELLAHPAGETPQTHALAALMYFQSSRNKARLDAKGGLLPLLEQDRRLWDQGRIQEGLMHLARAQGTCLTEYHLLAGIAACHATAPEAAETAWGRIASLYDHLLHFNQNAHTLLNRAVAYAHAFGPTEGLALLEKVAQGAELKESYLVAAARGDCYLRLGLDGKAHDAFRQAADLAPTTAEKRFFQHRARDLSS